MTNETLIVLCWELYEQGMPKIQIAKRLGRHRETIHLWIRSINTEGLLGFLDKYKPAKKGERKKRQVDPPAKVVRLAFAEVLAQAGGQAR